MQYLKLTLLRISRYLMGWSGFVVTYKETIETQAGCIWEQAKY